MTALAAAGLLDTSVVIDLQDVDPAMFPPTVVVTSVTMAELALGPLLAADPVEKARRTARAQWAMASLDALPFDEGAARYYGALCGLVIAAGRHPRRRMADIMIASIAAVRGLPLYTRNPDDFHGLDELVKVVTV